MGTELYHAVAERIIAGFDRYFDEFQAITAGASERFITANWQAVQSASVKRIDLYKKVVVEVCSQLKEAFGEEINEPDFWRGARQSFAESIKHYKNYKIAESFFNSIYCDIFQHQAINNDYMFVHSSDPDGTPVSGDEIYKRYTLKSSITSLLGEIINDSDFGLPFQDKERDIRRIVRSVKHHLLPFFKDDDKSQIVVELIRPIFYRNKAAYVVGRIVSEHRSAPFVLPILNDEKGTIYVDALISNPDDVSIIFSFTRSYFMVESKVPRELVGFLHSLMPHKEKGELFNSIGYCKHGKTEFYRSFLKHLENSEDQFVIAPGIKGMVMSVFTLPSYPVVFKIIKDKFDPPKTMTREDVREKYRMVSRHDRVGRMADTQEFANFVFDHNRFSQELLDELEQVSPSMIRYDGDKIIIKHLYTERRMTPLNLYLRGATEEQIEAAMEEYGNAIKQLSAANIFPGDMLLKNFGVTRHGRVVFYDYDEICPLTKCNFRKIPEPRTEAEEYASTPWYTIGPDDIFPEEFSLFFSGNPTARKVFDKLHSDLYEVEYWKTLQRNIESGIVEDVFPYRRRKRFEQQ